MSTQGLLHQERLLLWRSKSIPGKKAVLRGSRYKAEQGFLQPTVSCADLKAPSHPYKADGVVEDHCHTVRAKCPCCGPEQIMSGLCLVEHQEASSDGL